MHQNKYQPSFLNWKQILFFWLLIAVISTTTLYLQLISRGLDSLWIDVFWVKLAIWLFWGGFAILIAKMALRFRIEGGTIVSGLLFHIPFCVFSIAINVFFYALLAYWIGLDSFNDMGVMQIFFILFIGLFDWYFIIYWAVVLTTYAIDYFKKLQQRKIHELQLESKVIQAQLQALKMQLQPHFLFNTLNTVASLVRQDNKKTAIEMLSGLSELLRTTLQQKDQQQISLKEELAFIRKYLELEKKRFNNQIEVDWEVEADTLGAKVPTFMLQPLVENAIYHGLSKRLNARLLKIKAWRKNETLFLDIYNDGPPLPDHFDMSMATGIGLANTVERLYQFFGEKCQLEVRNAFSGVLVSIQFPYSSYGQNF